MPTVEPYEVMMRRNGQTWALHARSLITLDDGTVVEGKPVPLAGLSDPAFAEIAELVSASKDNEITTLTTERDSLQSQLAELTADLQTAASQLEATTTQLHAANASIETLQARIDELENPPNPFPNADWQAFRQAALNDPAVLRVAKGNPVLWPVLFMYLSELSTNPSRGPDIAWLWNTMEGNTPVTKEEVARVNGIAQQFGVPLRMNDEGQIQL